MYTLSIRSTCHTRKAQLLLIFGPLPNLLVDGMDDDWMMIQWAAGGHWNLRAAFDSDLPLKAEAWTVGSSGFWCGPWLGLGQTCNDKLSKSLENSEFMTCISCKWNLRFNTCQNYNFYGSLGRPILDPLNLNPSLFVLLYLSLRGCKDTSCHIQ